MKKTVICSICSRAKKDDAGLLPAKDRYVGSHISKVRGFAKREGLPFFILSGVYGFISGDELIPYYDHLLVAHEVEALVPSLLKQLRKHEVEVLHFYTKTKPNWVPYRKALEEATKSLGIGLTVHELGDND